jgi:nitrate reductase NapD
MPDKANRHYISSAVIVVRPEAEERVVRDLAAMERVEVHAIQGGKIVVVIEGASSGELGASLSAISAIDGVVAANMVFEHSENVEAMSDDRRIDAA